jgi:heat shock protein HslJ
MVCWPNNTSFLGGLLCNHYEGRYKATRDSLSVSDVFATEMGCLEPEGILEQETACLTALRTAATYQITADRLEMFDEAGIRVLVFVAQETDSCLSFSWSARAV